MLSMQLLSKGSAKTVLLIGLAAVTVSLSGCIGLLATGAAVGAVSAADRRSTGSQADDQGIEIKALLRIKDVVANPGGINVTSYNRRALLTGQVLDVQSKVKAGEAVAAIDGVRQVHNELIVSGRADFRSNAADTLTTTKVKAALLETKTIPSWTIKVNTEQGIVYLMGLVTAEEAAKAAQTASFVGGVQKVVTVFESLSTQELRAIENQPAK
jgi:osmotically-inducible protein OsmY